MTRFVVASHFVWNEYPGLRAGRAYAGLPDVSRSPLGGIHLVEEKGAVETVCGLPRASVPHDFPELTDVGLSDLCPTCRAATPR